MPQLAVAGAEIHYQVLGQGAPVILIHGLLIGNMAGFYFGIAAELAKKNKVILYDLRGHGLSEKTVDGYTLEQMVVDLELLVKEVGLDKVSLAGHSYGGLVALRFALKNPAIVDRLIVIEAPLPPGRVAEMESFFVKTPEQILNSLPDKLKTIMSAPTRQAKKSLDRIMFLLNQTKLIHNLKAETDIPDSDLKNLKTPTLVIYGKKGKLGDVSSRLSQNVPNSRLCLLDGAHDLPSEVPVELANKISEFLI